MLKRAWLGVWLTSTCRSNVVKMEFSCKSRFESYSSRCNHVRRLIGARYVNRYIFKMVKFPMVWGVIKGVGTKTLVNCPNRLNSNSGYKTIVSWYTGPHNLNLIENLWSIVKTKVGKRIFSHSKDL